jgi:anti-sigma regulatory factor (Ser/Thr protein kinase)
MNVMRAWCLVVPHHARGARLVRRRLAEALAGVIGPDRLGDIVAVTGELVGNAIRHATPLPGGVVRVAWKVLANGCVQIRVTDGGAETPPIARLAPPDAMDGRGLTIVNALSARWGVERDGLGQCVWAEI